MFLKCKITVNSYSEKFFARASLEKFLEKNENS